MVVNIHPLAGTIVPRSMLVDIPRLLAAYYQPKTKLGKVEFGTSGHRGSSLKGTFCEMQIAAIAQAIAEYRQANNITGPLFMGYDTHALSEPAFRTAVQVLRHFGIEVVVHAGGEYTPTPVISRMIINYNREREAMFADGIVITPSHNGPQDGGFKYNPTHGGPADTNVTKCIEDRANVLLAEHAKAPAASTLARILALNPFEAVIGGCYEKDFMGEFVLDLGRVVDMNAIRGAGLRLAADPMGGAGVNFWARINEVYGLKIEVVNPAVEPDFRFMALDHDGTVRMDCSSLYAMATLVSLAEKYDVAWGNDTDYDRHGIVCRGGLMNPNHYLATAISYLFSGARPQWSANAAVGKTLVSSSIIDRVVEATGRRLVEVPVGFKWFVDGLRDGNIGFGGEESAGASFLCLDGSTWTTDKDGFALVLLAAEMTARTGRTPQEYYNDITKRHGSTIYRRDDLPITAEQKAKLKAIKPESIPVDARIAGLSVTRVLTTAPGNGAAIGGIKVALSDGSWFAIRPSGTEPKMKVYAESFGGQEQLEQIIIEGQRAVFG